MYKAVAMFYKINDIIICHMLLSFLFKKKSSKHEIYEIRYIEGFFYSTEREKGKRKDESCETIDIWQDQEI